MKPYARFVTTYGYRPKVNGLTDGQIDIGLLMCIPKLAASRVLETVMGINAAFNTAAYLSVLAKSGVSDKTLQRAEIEVIKNKEPGNDQNWSF